MTKVELHIITTNGDNMKPRDTFCSNNRNNHLNGMNIPVKLAIIAAGILE